MPFREQYVVVKGHVWVADPDAHPEHPIYIPIEPPPDTGLHPEHPIYFPVGIWGGGDPFPTPPIFIPGPPSDAHPEHPIYYPVTIWGPTDPFPTPPINLPGGEEPDWDALKRFLLGNLPEYVAPHKR